MSKKKVGVVIGEDEVLLPLEVLQSEIIKLSNIGKQINESRLKQRAILLLLQDITKLPRNHIMYVLNALPILEETYLKKGN